jgi:alpha-2-macroglobulin
LYRLTPKETDYEYQARRVGYSEALSSRDLYVDEITISLQDDANYKYGILEVPLTPGAELEDPTYGMYIEDDEDDDMSITNARYVTGDQFYAVPIENLDGDVVIRNLVRFSQKGRFILPRTRFYRMYNPFAKAFEDDTKRVNVD